MSDLIRRHWDVLAPVIAFNTNLHIVSAEGIWVKDGEGNRWADFACGTAVTNLGHNHPAVVEAAKAQLDKLVHSGMIFHYDAVVEAAEHLRDVTPPRHREVRLRQLRCRGCRSSCQAGQTLNGTPRSRCVSWRFPR